MDLLSSLPVKGEMDVVEHEPPQGVKESGSKTVLIVEDDTAVRKAVRFILQKTGYQVLEAGDGEEAMQVFEQHAGPVDLLLTDVLLPGKSGPELAGQVREKQPGMKILYVSGYSKRAVVDQEVSRKGAEFLRKPFSLDELVVKVRKVLEAGRD